MAVDITLTAVELAQRGVPFIPIRPVPAVYTHVGAALHFRSNRRLGVRLIIDHTTEAGSTVTGALRYDARRADSVSCTAFAADDGLGYDVDEYDTPFTTGRWNDESLSCETVGKAAWTAAEWRSDHAAVIARKIELFTDWCRRFDIPPVWLSAEQIADGATREGVVPWRAGVQRGICDHREANLAAIKLGGSPLKYSHVDVGAGMREVLVDTILPEVRRRLDPPEPQPEPDPDEEDMALAKILIPKGAWVVSWYPHLAAFDSGAVRPAVSEDINPREGTGNINDEGQYRRTCAAAGIQLVSQFP